MTVHAAQGYLGCLSEPLEAVWQTQAVTARIVVVYNQSQVASVELVVCWHLTESSDAGLDQVLQHASTLLNTCLQFRWVRSQGSNSALLVTAYLAQSFAFAFEVLHKKASVCHHALY